MFPLVSFSRSKFFTRVALVSLVLHPCRTRGARPWHLCYKTYQIFYICLVYNIICFLFFDCGKFSWKYSFFLSIKIAKLIHFVNRKRRYALTKISGPLS